jgi:hypothetical protein
LRLFSAFYVLVIQLGLFLQASQKTIKSLQLYRHPISYSALQQLGCHTRVALLMVQMHRFSAGAEETWDNLRLCQTAVCLVFQAPHQFLQDGTILVL